MSLAERLGYRPEDRLLIISADRLGSTHAANIGVFGALREGVATTAGLMVPCLWSRHAAREYRGEEIGVHLTLNAELDMLRWGPITQAPSLLDGDGGFPRTVADLWDHADVSEVRRELRAQVERAVVWGFDVSHLSTHQYAVQQRPEFFDVYLDLAIELGLPMRLQDTRSEEQAGFPFRQLAADEGVLTPDRVVELTDRSNPGFTGLVESLEPGVTELVIRPAVDSAELRAADPSWADRVADHAVATGDWRVTLDRAGITLLGYRAVRAVQRAA